MADTQPTFVARFIFFYMQTWRRLLLPSALSIAPNETSVLENYLDCFVGAFSRNRGMIVSPLFHRWALVIPARNKEGSAKRIKKCVARE